MYIPSNSPPKILPHFLNGLVESTLSETISDILSEGHAVKVQGIGTFRPKKGTQREFISNLTGEKFSKITKNGVLFKPDVCLSEKLNK